MTSKYILDYMNENRQAGTYIALSDNHIVIIPRDIAIDFLRTTDTKSFCGYLDSDGDIILTPYN